MKLEKKKKYWHLLKREMTTWEPWDLQLIRRRIRDRVQSVSAIGLHDESTGGATDPISAALIIADKTDVRRSRVREKNKATFDKHDRVNYAVTDTKLKINVEKRVISLNLQIDPKICSMYEYFEIFLGRMMMCKRAAEVLEASFKLTMNGSKVL